MTGIPLAAGYDHLKSNDEKCDRDENIAIDFQTNEPN